MTDIVERLRLNAEPTEGDMEDAAQEIERLRAAAQQIAGQNRAEYWEAQASMWHENYKEAIRYEDEARRFRDALLRIKAGGYGTKERVRLIIARALDKTESTP